MVIKMSRGFSELSRWKCTRQLVYTISSMRELQQSAIKSTFTRVYKRLIRNLTSLYRLMAAREIIVIGGWLACGESVVPSTDYLSIASLTLRLIVPTAEKLHIHQFLLRSPLLSRSTPFLPLYLALFLSALLLLWDLCQQLENYISDAQSGCQHEPTCGHMWVNRLVDKAVSSSALSSWIFYEYHLLIGFFKYEHPQTSSSLFFSFESSHQCLASFIAVFFRSRNSPLLFYAFLFFFLPSLCRSIVVSL